MKFMFMEDQTLTHEVTLFPRVYSRCGHLTAAMCAFAFEGRVQDGFGACSLIADKVKVFENGVLAKTDYIKSNNVVNDILDFKLIRAIN